MGETAEMIVLRKSGQQSGEGVWRLHCKSPLLAMDFGTLEEARTAAMEIARKIGSDIAVDDGTDSNIEVMKFGSF